MRILLSSIDYFIFHEILVARLRRPPSACIYILLPMKSWQADSVVRQQQFDAAFNTGQVNC